MTGWRRWLRLSSLTALVVIVYFLVPLSLDLGASDVVRILISAVVLALVTGEVIRQVVLQLADVDRRIDGLVIALVVSVLAFALGFYVMDLRDPAQIAGLHTRLDALYFTMTTLLTIGFGDIHAAGQAARALVLVQMLYNVVIIATAVSILSSRVRSRAAVRAENRRTGDRSDRDQRRQGRRTHRNPT